MTSGHLKRLIPTAAPIGILILIGMLVLSALLYYKSVRGQRYLEPSLALAQPRIEFANQVTLLFQKEFGLKRINGVVLSGNSIFVDNSLIFDSPANPGDMNRVFLEKLCNVFLSMLNDPEMRSHFDLILVSARIHFSTSIDENKIRRIRGLRIADSIVESMYSVAPDLLKHYGMLAPTAVPDKPSAKYNWMEFRIVPSERVHVEMMESLNKYFF